MNMLNIIKIGKSGSFFLHINDSKFCATSFDDVSYGDRGFYVSLMSNRASDIKLINDFPDVFVRNVDDLIDAIFQAKLFIKNIDNKG